MQRAPRADTIAADQAHEDRMNLPADESAALLREIRDNQRLQLERQAEALAMQREQFEMAKQQMGRAERIHDRSEAIQDLQASMVAFGKRLLWLIVPLLVVLFLLVLYPFARFLP
jgi:uncharacterized membrane protein (DUF106 family)